jgi:C1A family cysteine protease
VPLPFVLPTFRAAAPLGTLTAPSSYDLRTYGKVTPVKNQNPYGTCWAFATLGSLESSLMPSSPCDLSEDNLVLTSGFDSSQTVSTAYNAGGNDTMSTAYLARGGPVSEADDPYGDGVAVPGLAPRLRLQQQLVVCNDGAEPKDTAGDEAAIKDALQTYGALYTSMIWKGSAYNATYHSYYGGTSQYVIANAGHAVTIVGWDDNYPASNFTDVPADGNGAWIVKNSWGSSWGDQGYFYLSYYDYWAGRYAAAFTAVDVGLYTTTYEYDPLGACSFFYWPFASSAWEANDFTATSSDPITGVGFYTVAPNMQYVVYTASTHTGGRTQQASGTATLGGYHYVPLASALPVTNGQAFSIIVKLTAPSGSTVDIMDEMKISGYSSAADPQAGQSFATSDFGGLPYSWQDVGDPVANGIYAGDLCIKAFARPAASDTTPPVTTASGVPGGWVNHSVTLSFTATDTGGWGVLCTQATISPASYHQCSQIQVSGQGAHTVYYSSCDKAGNWEGNNQAAVDIDLTAPATSASGLQASAGSGWINHAQSVTLTPSDSGGSGLAHTYYTLDGGGQQTYSGAFSVSGQSSHIVTYWSSDNAGNTEGVHTGYVNIDLTAPTTSASGLQPSAGGGWLNQAQTVTLTPGDSGGSDLAHTYYTLDGGGQQTYSSAFAVSTDGSHTVTYWSSDNAGNSESVHTGYVNIDLTSPTVTDDAPATWSKTAVTVTLTPQDTGGSKVAGTQYRLAGSSTWIDAVGNQFVVSADPNVGIHTYEYRALDNAGNASSLVGTCTVRIDGTPPVTTAYRVSVRHNRRVKLSYLVKDVSGAQAVVTIKIYKAGRLKKTLKAGTCDANLRTSYSWRCRLARGSYTFRVKAKDLAGNPQSKIGSARLRVR